MDRDTLKALIKRKKPKGLVYIFEHYEVIKHLIDEGEKPNLIYEALTETDHPPPISMSQFYRHLKNQNIIQKTPLEKPNPSSKQTVQPTDKVSNPRHFALNGLKKTKRPIHDSGIDADKLI